MECYKMEENLKDLYGALLLLFDENGQVKEEGLAQIVQNAMENEGLDVLYVNGSSGENIILDTELRKKACKVVKEVVSERAKSLDQVRTLDLYETIEPGKYATELLSDTISVVTPSYYPFTFEEIKDYYSKLI